MSPRAFMIGLFASALVFSVATAAPSHQPGDVFRDCPTCPEVVVVLQFFSGVFFIFTTLPSWMQHFAAIFPLKWLTQGMRSVFLPDSFATQEAAKSWEINKIAIILIAWLIAGVFISLKTFKWTKE